MSAGVRTGQDARGPIPEALRRFIWDIQSVVELAESEREILLIGRDLMARLIASGDWLPAAFSDPIAGGACQYQIYVDGMERFCVVSTILSGGAAIAVSQPCPWEILGVVGGVIKRRPLDVPGDEALLQRGVIHAARSGGAGGFELSSPPGEPAVVLHVYGGEVGKLTRRIFASGTPDAQALGYANGETAPPYDIFSIQADIRDSS